MTTKKTAKKSAAKTVRKGPRAKYIPIYVSEEERAKITANAEAAGVPVSIHMRQVYFAKSGK